jgi:2,4-dienoyl-CoA reductase-like NADH-dependent reductase (Old Yellow Enzyme family)
MEVLEEVRNNVGFSSDFIVGVRMVGKTGDFCGSGPAPGELEHEECLEIARMLANTGCGALAWRFFIVQDFV